MDELDLGQVDAVVVRLQDLLELKREGEAVRCGTVGGRATHQQGCSVVSSLQLIFFFTDMKEHCPQMGQLGQFGQSGGRPQCSFLSVRKKISCNDDTSEQPWASASNCKDFYSLARCCLS